MKHSRKSRDSSTKKKRKKQLEARILIKRLPDGRCEILCYDPQTEREIPTGMRLWPGEVDERVRQLKTQLEQADNYVVVKEL
jgi:hypothetical protein